MSDEKNENTTGLRTREEIDSSFPTMEANYPHYKRGFVVGGRPLRKSSQNIPEKKESRKQEPDKK